MSLVFPRCVLQVDWQFPVEMEGMTLAMQKRQSLSTSIYFSVQWFFTNN